MEYTKKRILATIKQLKEPKAKVRFVIKKIRKAKEEGYDINTKFESGRTILHYIIEYGHSKVIKTLINYGCNPDLCDDNFMTPLHLAVVKNDKKAVKSLLKGGADVDIPGEFEQTPLHLATILGDLKMIKILIKYHADLLLVDEKNLSVIDYANDEKNIKIINFLKKKFNKKEEN